MTRRDNLISYWKKSAESDLVVAEHLFEKRDYHYCLFFGHLVLEKALKARYPDIKFSFFKKCTKVFTEDYFQKIKEFYQWLKVRMQLEE